MRYSLINIIITTFLRASRGKNQLNFFSEQGNSEIKSSTLSHYRKSVLTTNNYRTIIFLKRKFDTVKVPERLRKNEKKWQSGKKQRKSIEKKSENK